MSSEQNIENAIALANNQNSTEADYLNAIKILSNVLPTVSNKRDIFYNRAVCYLNTTQFELAVFDFSVLIEIDPNKAFNYSCRAFAKARTDDKKGAIADYEKALELEPDNPITYNNMGLVQEEIGYIKQANKSFEQSDDLRKKEEANKVLHLEDNQNVKQEVETRLEKAKVETAEGKSLDVPIPPTETVVEKTKSEIAKDIFTDKNTFKEFIQFIKNGFKLSK
jgi:tetratricopeptide (TPR) repeat protein